MTSQKRLMLKIAIVMILIIGAPIIYFFAIGENPFFDESNGTKNIAVVNEDTGAEKEENALEFGKEVATVLTTDSDFNWSVVSRSAAEKGLAGQDYDAIVYIPSNFSKNIMTYEEQQPVKAEFKYTVGGQLNAANREKVLREIDKATARVNGKIATLYWSYVSQDLEKVRNEFDTILQKEIEFLNTISEFYRPNLASVVGDIESQKQMLENLASTVSGTPIDGSIQEAGEFEVLLSQFVSYVNDYKEYHTTQQQLLQPLQQESLLSVVFMKNDQEPRYNETKNYLIDHNDSINENVQMLEDQLAKNKESVNNLTSQVVKQREEIIDLLNQVEGELLVQYENQLITLKDQLNTSSPSQVQPIQAKKSGDEKNNTRQFIASSKIAALDSERDKLISLIQNINSVKEEVVIASANTTEINDENSNKEVLAVNDQLSQLSSQIAVIESNINQIQQQERQLQEELIESQESQEDAKGDELKPEINEFTIVEEVKRKESEIMNSPLMNGAKKESLKSVFSKTIDSNNTAMLMEYYGALAQYETILKTNLSVNNLLVMNNEGSSILNELQQGVPDSQEQLVSLEEGVKSFFTEYTAKVDSDYEAISSQIQAVETSANNMQKSLDSFISGSTVFSVPPADGNALVSNQHSIIQNLTAMSNSMNSIMTNQDNIMLVTNDLYAKASNVNADTNELNNKWNDNVSTTEKYRNDIHNVLNNAFVDGQRNGHIYDHLSTPLTSTSLNATVEENKVPPVIVLVIVLISSLLIGYFCYYFNNNKPGVRIALFSLLNLIVGLIISIYGMEIYSLNETGTIEWTIFTILLLAAVSTIIFASFSIGPLIGWFVSVAVIAFFVTPMLTLLASNLDYEDPMSKVYLSIQYGPESLIIPASIVLLVIIGVFALIPYIAGKIKNRSNEQDEEPMYEM